jgi:hypothetical protein
LQFDLKLCSGLTNDFSAEGVGLMNNYDWIPGWLLEIIKAPTPGQKLLLAIGLVVVIVWSLAMSQGRPTPTVLSGNTSVQSFTARMDEQNRKSLQGLQSFTESLNAQNQRSLQSLQEFTRNLDEQNQRGLENLRRFTEGR